MNCYVCVYLQPIIEKEWEQTWDEASDDKPLKKFLKRYERRFKKGKGRFYDWGDDPSFFAAEEFLGDVRKASWGVCRHDVRKKLGKGDMIIFFCAQEWNHEPKLWKYYYIGLGTVGEVLHDRKMIWTKKRYEGYRQFYNLLRDVDCNHDETIYPHHDNWEERAAAPYIIFESSCRTHFNLTNPLLVATYQDGDGAWKDEILEVWKTDNETVKRIYALTPKRAGGKKLHTSTTGYAHRHMNLSKVDDKQLRKKRRQLLRISNEVADFNRQTI